MHFSLVMFVNDKFITFAKLCKADVLVDGAVDSDLIPNLVKPMSSKLIYTSSFLDAQRQKGQCEEQTEKFAFYAGRKSTKQDSPILEW